MAQGSNGYSDRVQRVVDYLLGHLDEALDLETLARVACLSPYHFHRIYRGLLGETVNETVRRLRLQRAALDLLDRELSIERTARRAGYSSQRHLHERFVTSMASRPPAIPAPGVEPRSRKGRTPLFIRSRSNICRNCV